MMDDILSERYRPRSVEDFVNLPTGIKGVFDQEDMPHLLFVGRAGLGKTTLAYMLIKHFGYSSLELNASDERGIDVMRNKVKMFATKQGMKICLLDEAGYLTKEAQATLRRIMEIYKTCRFILTTNYLGKIIEPIRSRCMVVEFTSPSQEDVLSRLQYICKEENIKYDEERLNEIVRLTLPDIRSAVNTLQYSCAGGKLEQVKIMSDDIGEAIYLLIGDKKWGVLRKLLRSQPIDYSSVYSYLFNRYFELSGDKVEEQVITIAERMSKDAFSSDKEINFVAGCMELGGL